MSGNVNTIDVAVVGCGPAGSTVGLHLAERGYDVLAIESQSFPRYHIGESLTGTVGLYLREAGFGEEMERRRFPVKYGVKVMGKNARNEFFVAAAPEPTWQVRRDEFDDMLLKRAVETGMTHSVGAVRSILTDGDRVTGCTYSDPDGEIHEVKTRCGLIDASGQQTLLSNQGIAGKRVIDTYGKQVAIFTQIKDCLRDPGLMRDNTIIFYNDINCWAWIIPLTEDLVSVGVVLTLDTYKRIGQQVKYRDVSIPSHVLRWGLENINPDLFERCGDREWVEPVRVIRDYSYRVAPYAGNGWLCLGDSHAFVDPIFSFGVGLAIHEARLAADTVDAAMATGNFNAAAEKYQYHCEIGQRAVADVIRYFWRFPGFFGVQARGKYREDIMKLFAGACYDENPLPGLVMMRESLAKVQETHAADTNH